MDIIEITGVIKEYEWGNTTFIADLLGQKGGDKRQAELWYSTHPDGESVVVETQEPLSTLLKRDPDHWFGNEHLAVYGPTLPLLLKVLAIDKPLSLQVHPTHEQAEAGWESEHHIREKLPKELWNYKDPNGKPEMAYVLTPTTVMCGFRPLDEIRSNLKTLIPTAYDKHFAFLDEDDATHISKKFFKVVYGLGKEERDPLLAEYLQSVTEDTTLLHNSDEQFLHQKDIVMLLAEQYPGDLGLLSPFLLNVLHLQAGEALYLEPGILHAYIKGNVIELMSASDNVVRGGLTPKKIDVAELLRIMRVDGGPIERAPLLTGRSGRLHVLTPTEDFHLMVLESGHYEISERLSIELLFVTEGSARFRCKGEDRTLEKGRCYVVASGADSYELEVDGRVFAADVPR